MNNLNKQDLPIESEEELQYFDYSQLIENDVFIGKYPLQIILESITKQFNDYIKLEDISNYVDIFYDQLHNSYLIYENDESEEHVQEAIQILDRHRQIFTDFMQKIIFRKLTLSIPDLEKEAIAPQDIEFLFRRIYEFFILGAKNNFKTLLTNKISKIIEIDNIPEENYLNIIQDMINNYHDIIEEIVPQIFLEIRNDKEIIEIFENGLVVGNFLRRYSPRFYRNEEFMIDVINHITMTLQFKNEIIDNK